MSHLSFCGCFFVSFFSTAALQRAVKMQIDFDTLESLWLAKLTLSWTLSVHFRHLAAFSIHLNYQQQPFENIENCDKIYTSKGIQNLDLGDTNLKKLMLSTTTFHPKVTEHCKIFGQICLHSALHCITLIFKGIVKKQYSFSLPSLTPTSPPPTLWGPQWSNRPKWSRRSA